jgi:hypothetical protein
MTIAKIVKVKASVDSRSDGFLRLRLIRAFLGYYFDSI